MLSAILFFPQNTRSFFSTLLLGIFFSLKPLYGTEILRLAATTSTAETGLFETILPPFENATGIKVHVIGTGTGTALRLGKAGDVDMVLVHSEKDEEEFLASGNGTSPVEIMRNDFIILGPADDPADIRSSENAIEAVRRIARKGVTFISRGDMSGTHSRELMLWRKAGITPSENRLLETGQGMSETLRIASEKQAYTLSDRATYFSMKPSLELKILFEGDDFLLNRYRIILVSPLKHPHVRWKQARMLAEYLISPECQKLIGSYKKNGEVLFKPVNQSIRCGTSSGR